MIWFDLVTPKSVMFFKSIIAKLKERGFPVLVTAREADGYTEIVELLRLYDIPFYNIGAFGGARLEDKLKASIDRQFELMDFVKRHDAKRLVSICSVDANRVAFGLGILIINFYDIPISDYTVNFKKALPQTRLTLPLSYKAFRPFMVPQEIFERFGLEADQIYSYNFLDVFIWLHDFVPDRGYFDAVLAEYGLDSSKPTIIAREEEFKASYVKAQHTFMYDGLKMLQKELDANYIVIPRYEPEPLQLMLPFAAVLTRKMVVQHLLAFCDLFIGGGGTLNSEACYFGTPAISTRSFVSHYDKLLIDEGLMQKADSAEELFRLSKRLCGQKTNSGEFFAKMSLNIDKIVEQIIS